jgi:PA domain
MVSVQEFTFGRFLEAGPPELERLTPTADVYATPADFRASTGSGEASASGEVVPIDVVMPPTGGSTSGCEAADFTGTAGWDAGDIALVQRGTCPYVQKAELAQAAGASGLILYNEGNSPDRLDVPGNLPLGAEGVDIPGAGTSFAVGQEVLRPVPDHQPAGLGLLGSAHYVESLSEAQRQDIIGVLNFDMLGSPSFVRFVYDGDGSAGLVGGAGPPGSDYIEQVFLEYFAAQGLVTGPGPRGQLDAGATGAAGSQLEKLDRTAETDKSVSRRYLCSRVEVGSVGG